MSEPANKQGTSTVGEKKDGTKKDTPRVGGTWVNEEEVIHFSKPPEGLRFYIDEKNKVWAQFTDPKDGRRFPFDHPVLQAYIFTLLTKGKRRPPTKDELFIYKQRCIAAAVEEFRQREDPADLILQRETVVEAIYLNLYDITERSPEDSWQGAPKNVRDKLLETAKAKDWDTSEWPKANHFTEYLDLRKQFMAEHNIRYERGKKNGNRYYRFTWIDPRKVPHIVPDVGRGREGSQQDAALRPSPFNGILDDAPQASLGKPKGKKVTERIGQPEAYGNPKTAEDDEESTSATEASEDD